MNKIIKIICAILLLYNLFIFTFGGYGALLLGDIITCMLFGFGCLINLVIIALFVYDVVRGI